MGVTYQNKHQLLSFDGLTLANVAHPGRLRNANAAVVGIDPIGCRFFHGLALVPTNRLAAQTKEDRVGNHGVTPSRHRRKAFIFLNPEGHPTIQPDLPSSLRRDHDVDVNRARSMDPC